MKCKKLFYLFESFQVILQKNGPPPRCSRFYAHMEARAVHSRAPHFLSAQPRPQPISLGEKQRQQPLIPPQHQAWPGQYYIFIH